MDESSFQKGFGGGCGLLLSIFLALVLVPTVTIGGCCLLGVGSCAMLLPAVKSAREASERAQATQDQANQTAEQIVVVETKDPHSEQVGPEPPPNPPVEFRTWTDVTNTFQVEAEFVCLTMNRVKLQKRDGSEIIVQKDQLCEKDQEWLRLRSKRSQRL